MNPIFKLSLAALLLGSVVGCDSTPDIHVTCTPDGKDGGGGGEPDEEGGGGGGEPDGQDAGATGGGKDSGATGGGKDSGATGNQDSGAAGNKDAAIDSGPAPTGEWKNATGNLGAMTSACGAVSYVVAKPDEDRLIVGLAGKGLWSSVNGGGSWAQLGDAAGELLKTRPSWITFDPTDPKVYWMSGIYGPGAFRTNDNGTAFAVLGSVQHVDGVAVDFSDPERKVLVAGGHEEKQTVYRSADKGMTWKNVGAGLPADKNCTTPLVLDSTTYLVGCSHFSQGIYRTTDSGEHWESVFDKGGSRVPLRAKDGAIYWPGLDGSGLVRSTDDGKTWKSVINSGGVISVQSPSPIELPDGRIAIVGTETILASSDKGETWKAVSVRLPSSTVEIIGFTYSTQQKAFFIVYTNCNDKALTDAIQRYDYPMP